MDQCLSEIWRRRAFAQAKKQSYSVQFKIDAIELYQTSELSYRKVANHLGINQPALVFNWMKIFRSEGLGGLLKMKGCSSNLSKKEEKQEISKLTSKEHSRIKELEKQVRSLQIENAFLKEFRKLNKIERINRTNHR
ncbi:hypothetical protein IGK31_003182 [Enterococcus sp. DIV1288f]